MKRCPRRLWICRHDWIDKLHVSVGGWGPTPRLVEECDRCGRLSGRSWPAVQSVATGRWARAFELHPPAIDADLATFGLKPSDVPFFGEVYDGDRPFPEIIGRHVDTGEPVTRAEWDRLLGGLPLAEDLVTPRLQIDEETDLAREFFAAYEDRISKVKPARPPEEAGPAEV